MNIESPLKGGRSAEGVVRIEDTVRRPLGTNSAFVHSILKLLEEKGFAHSPRFLGIDEKNREILSFMEGEVPHIKIHWTDEQLVEVAHILKQFHDSTAGSDLVGTNEVICHNDFAPWNLVLENGKPIAIIDFDDAAPGNRSDDLAYVLWTFLDLGGDLPVGEQVRRIKLICEAYGFQDGTTLIDSLLIQQENGLHMRERLATTAKTEEARNFSADRVIQIRSQIEWVKANRHELEEALL